MTEALSPQDNDKAKAFYAVEADRGPKVEFYQETAEEAREEAKEAFDTGNQELGEIMLKQARHEEVMGERHALHRDANLWRAQQHNNEHLPEYIETARQEAEAQGIEVNLPVPKE